MEDEQRERARVRYAGCCGYCGVHENNTGATLTIDHHRPRAHDGGDDDGNIVYCCVKCNLYKGAYWHEVDPPNLRLLHPLNDDLTVHLYEDESGQLVGLTPPGVFFIQRLHLNRSQLVAYRLQRGMVQKQHDDLDTLRQQMRELQQRVVELNEALEFVGNEIERERS